MTAAASVLEIRAFAGNIRRDARRLDLLRAIENTIDALHRDQKRWEADADYADRILGHLLCKEVVGAYEESKVVLSIEGALDSLRVLHAHLSECHESAKCDPELEEDDGVVEAFESALLAVHRLHSAMEKIRWFVLEHNSDALGRVEGEATFSDPDELRKHLDSL